MVAACEVELLELRIGAAEQGRILGRGAGTHDRVPHRPRFGERVEPAVQRIERALEQGLIAGQPCRDAQGRIVGRNVNQHFGRCTERTQAPLHGVAHVDGYVQCRRPVLHEVTERQQPCHACERDCHGVHINSEHTFGAGSDDGGRRKSRRPARVDQVSHRMEQEGARATGRIEHALIERARDRRRDYSRRQPVGRVIFAEIMALVGIDQALVEAFEHVDFDVAQSKAHRLLGQRANEVGSVFREKGPIEEVGLNRANDALVR